MRVLGEDRAAEGEWVRDSGREAFCRDAYPRLVRALDLYCGDRHLAEELAQEALLRACRRWGHVSGLESPVGWCYRVGVNLAKSRFRRRRAERRATDHLQPEPEAASPEGQVGTALVVRDALDELTGQQRDAVVLRYFLDLDMYETADLLGSTPGAVRALCHRALQTLRGRLDIGLSEDVEVSDVP